MKSTFVAMIRKIGLLIAVLTVVSSSWSRAENILSITSETYFGECVGYCRTSLTITETQTTYTISAWRNEKPAKNITVPTSKELWREITEALPLKEFYALPETIGNPDGVDQGGERLKAVSDLREKETNFEYNAPLPGLSDALKVIRALRQEMDKKLGRP